MWKEFYGQTIVMPAICIGIENGQMVARRDTSDERCSEQLTLMLVAGELATMIGAGLRVDGGTLNTYVPLDAVEAFIRRRGVNEQFNDIRGMKGVGFTLGIEGRGARFGNKPVNLGIRLADRLYVSLQVNPEDRPDYGVVATFFVPKNAVISASIWAHKCAE